MRHESLLRILEVLLAGVAVPGISIFLSFPATAEESVPDGLTAGEWAGIRNAVNGKAENTAPYQRRSYRWRDEGIRNDRRGLEQRWTLQERPVCDGDKTLQIDLAVPGEMRAEVIPGPTARSDFGRRKA